MMHVYNHNIYAFYNSSINMTFNNIYGRKAKFSYYTNLSGEISKVILHVGMWPEIIYLGVAVNYASKNDHAAVTIVHTETI